MTEVEQLREALQNCLGFLDTPIARRKIGIDPNAEWLREARKLAENPTDFTHFELRSIVCGAGVPALYGTHSGRKPVKPEFKRIPADAGSHKFTDYAMPKVGDRVVWTSDPDPTCKLTGVKGTVVSVTLESNMPHFHVEPDDWKGARIYTTWHSVGPIKEEEPNGA